MEDAADQAVDVTHRPKFENVLWRQEANVNTDRLGSGRVLVVLVHPVVVHGEPQVANPSEADRLSGFLLEFSVKIDRILVHLADAVTHIKKRQQSRSMPGRTGCQLRFLEQDHVIPPALFGEVIECADAYDAAADDCNACMRFDSVICHTW